MFLEELLHDERIAYEEVRPIVALHQDIKSRAAEIGVSPCTLSRRDDQYIQYSIPGLVATTPTRTDDKRKLPHEIGEYLLQLKAEHPPFTARELAAIVEARFDRCAVRHTVEPLLARSPLPKLFRRRFPRYA